MPVVPLMVSAATGALLVPHTPAGQGAAEPGDGTWPRCGPEGRSVVAVAGTRPLR
ncbi:MAG: hypothetical protein JWR70_3277 [Modestobacter sp.]|jgi:hypothetical protein|nr:hypothetical protein [Modestobacter sp.]